MKQLKLFSRFNSSPEEMLGWFSAEQSAGRLYSKRELLRMPLETREVRGIPAFSRSGLVRTVKILMEEGLVRRANSVHGKIVVAGIPLPAGSACFLRSDV